MPNETSAVNTKILILIILIKNISYFSPVLCGNASWNVPKSICLANEIIFPSKLAARNVPWSERLLDSVISSIVGRTPAVPPEVFRSFLYSPPPKKNVLKYPSVPSIKYILYIQSIILSFRWSNVAAEWAASYSECSHFISRPEDR